MSVGRRIAAGFAAVLLALIVLTTIGIVRVNKINEALKVINDVNGVKERYAINFRGSVHDRSIAARDVTLVPDSELPAVIAHIQALEDAYKQSAEPMDAIFNAGSNVSEDERRQLQTIKSAEAKAVPLLHDIITKQRDGDNAGAKREVLEQARPAFVEWLAAVNGFIDMEEAQNKAKAAMARAVGVNFQYLMLTLTIVAIVIGTAIAFSITRNITQALGGEPAEVKAITNAIGDGNLAVPIHVRNGNENSILASLARMQISLRSVVDEVRGRADAVSNASAQIAIGSADMAKRTEQQATALQTTARSMGDVTEAVRSNAASAKQASTVTTETAKEVERGTSMVQDIVKTMDGITAESNRISDITSVIEGIAFQTNILALNAAVEAARAGEQGRGFAVVATEVRSLAQRSASAAKEIKELIGKSSVRVQQGAAEIHGAASAMSDILRSVRRVNNIVNEIADASAEQSRNVVNVGDAIALMDEGTQQNAVLVEQTSAAARSLDGQSGELRKAVTAFRTQ